MAGASECLFLNPNLNLNPNLFKYRLRLGLRLRLRSGLGAATWKSIHLTRLAHKKLVEPAGRASMVLLP
jgi:hypothetical protein